MIKNEREAGIRPQALAAGAGGEKHPAQIHRQRADGTDGVEAQFDAARGADFFESVEVIQHAG